VEAGKGKIIFGLCSSDLVLVLGIYIFSALHGQILFFHQLALGLIPSVQQALQFGSMSGIGGSTLASQFLRLSLKLDLNLGQFGSFSLSILELGSCLAELSILFSELALQLGNLLLRGLKLGGMSGSS